MALTQRCQWDVQGIDGLDYRKWYLVSSNHQSWVDILVLQHIFNRRIPLLKFFIKQELIWVPVMGLAWWALVSVHAPPQRGIPEKHPEMRGRDQETTRKACEKFAQMPTSVMNFLEGTRFTPGKQQRQQSPYRHLLKPKAGGFATALNAMGDKFNAITTRHHRLPAGAPSFWHFMCGKMPRVVVRVHASCRYRTIWQTATTPAIRRYARGTATGCASCGRTRTGRSANCNNRRANHGADAAQPAAHPYGCNAQRPPAANRHLGGGLAPNSAAAWRGSGHCGPFGQQPAAKASASVCTSPGQRADR